MEKDFPRKCLLLRMWYYTTENGGKVRLLLLSSEAVLSAEYGSGGELFPRTIQFVEHHVVG
jgi:hypothetical protein